MAAVCAAVGAAGAGSAQASAQVRFTPAAGTDSGGASTSAASGPVLPGGTDGDGQCQ
jgi:hypothetical protein